MSVDQTTDVKFRSLFGSGVGANLTGLGFSALSTLVTARVLGASGRGVVAVLTVIASYVVVIFSVSLEAGILHLGQRFPSKDDLLKRITTLLVILTLASVVTLSAFGYLLADGTLSVGTILIFGVGYGVPVAVAPVTAIERLRGRHHSAMWWPMIILAAQQALGLIWLGFYVTVGSYILGSAIGGLVATLAFFAMARPHKSSHTASGVETNVSIKNLVTYSLGGHLGVILYLLCGRLPVILAGVYLGDTAAGVYSVAVALAEVCLLVTQSQLGFVLAMATRNPDDFAPLKRQLKISAAFTAGIMAALLVASRWVPAVLGQDFSESTAVLIALSPGVVLLGLWRLAAYDLAARGKTRLRTISAAWGALTAVVLGMAAVRWGDVQSLAWSATATYAVMFVTLLRGFHRWWR